MAAKTSWHRYGTKLRHCHGLTVCRRRCIGKTLAVHAESMMVSLLSISGRHIAVVTRLLTVCRLYSDRVTCPPTTLFGDFLS